MSRLQREPVTAYRVEVGLDYDGKRVEPGEIVTDLPPESLDWLLEQRCISRITEGGE